MRYENVSAAVRLSVNSCKIKKYLVVIAAFKVINFKSYPMKRNILMTNKKASMNTEVDTQRIKENQLFKLNRLCILQQSFNQTLIIETLVIYIHHKAEVKFLKSALSIVVFLPRSKEVFIRLTIRQAKLDAL